MSTKHQTIAVTLQIHQDGSQMTLNIPATTKVSALKKVVSKNKKVSHQHCEIIFCGHVMNDDRTLEMYDITPSTTLHFVPRARHDYQSKPSIVTSKVSFLTGIWMHRLSDMSALQNFQIHKNVALSKTLPMFYAYCTRCARVVSCKLRVRCDTCKQDAVTVHRNPHEWNDVVRPNQILGCCRSNECEGNLCHADFYFKCVLCREETNIIPLPNVASNCNKFICLTCLETDHPVVTFPCYSDHVMCLYCIEQYARTNLRERSMICREKVGYTLECPEGCANSGLTDTHIFHILGSDEYQVYQSYAAEECLLRNMEGLICPNRQCGAGLFPIYDGQAAQKAKVQCPTCKHEFCSLCKEAYHGSTNCGACQPGIDHPKMVQEYFASIQTIKRISKKCPQCLTPTERSGGCMHMTCRTCRYEWCWHCVSAWNLNCQMDHWFG